MPQWYGPCDADEDCPAGHCVNGIGGPTGSFGFCSFACTKTPECPAPDSGDGVAICIEWYGKESFVCAVPCEAQGVVCPAGTECVSEALAVLGDFCAWPDDGICNDCAFDVPCDKGLTCYPKGAEYGACATSEAQALRECDVG